MSMPDQAQIDGLHQRAAESYLQGQFYEALGSWRALLALDPQDERAIEGIRLCELIVQQTEGDAFDEEVDDAKPFSAALPALAPGEGSDVDFEEIERILKESEAPESGSDADDAKWDFSGLTNAEPAGARLDLADLPDLVPGPGSPADDDDFDISGLDPAGPADGAQDEVERRVAELLSSAATSFDAGDVEGALTLLNRVFILDEDNAAAAALAEAFKDDGAARDEPGSGGGPVPDAVADDDLVALGLGPPASPAAHAGEAPWVSTPPERGSMDGALDSLDGRDEGLGKAVAAPAGRRDRGKGTAGSPARKRIMIGLGVVLTLAAAGFVGIRTSRTGGVSPDPVPAGETGPAQPATKGSAPDPLKDLVDPKAIGSAAPVDPHPDQDLGSAMARARAAFDAGDFSSAVVAYNAALQLAPNDPAAQRGLAAAGLAYQEQRKFRERLDAATEAYERGEYREALQILYRLPGIDGIPSFNRFKANGWFNLGVVALKMGSCSDATSHLAEAGALSPGDPTLAVVAGLARTCSASQGDPIWLGEVERLEVRSLDD